MHLLYCISTFRHRSNGANGSKLAIAYAMVLACAIGGCATGEKDAGSSHCGNPLLIVQVACIRPAPNTQDSMHVWCSHPMLFDSKGRKSNEAISIFQAGVTHSYAIRCKPGGIDRKQELVFQLRLSDMDGARLEAERAIRSFRNVDGIRQSSDNNDHIAWNPNLIASVKVLMSADNSIKCDVYEPYWTVKILSGVTRLSPTSIRFTTQGSIFVISVYTTKLVGNDG